MSQSYDDLISEALSRVREIFPWDLNERLNSQNEVLLIDVRERSEFAELNIPHSINVPRGILEQSCEWNYDETLPELARSREQDIVLICRSGKRSVLAADVMLKMGFTKVISLKLGVKGWNDSELPIQDGEGKLLNPDQGDDLLAPHLRKEQRAPHSLG
jgi:rhodanese-related sulfurtransferase